MKRKRAVLFVCQRYFQVIQPSLALGLCLIILRLLWNKKKFHIV